MFELFLLCVFLLVILGLPLAILGGLAYLAIWLFTISVKVVGAIIGSILAVVVCALVLAGLAVGGVFLLPFLVIFG